MAGIPGAGSLATFYFLPQGVVSGDGPATLERLRTNHTPYLIGVLLLFITYVMDVIVAWALYWFLRPSEPALSQLCAWMRLVYTGLAFMGLMATFSAFALARAESLANQVGDAALQAEILFRLSAANSISSVSLTFFGVHLLVLAVALWRSAHVPRWIAIAVALAGLAYPISYISQYIAPELYLGWLLAFALGELVFMVWMLVAGCRLPRPSA
jgi:hypothetical protein